LLDFFLRKKHAALSSACDIRRRLNAGGIREYRESATEEGKELGTVNTEHRSAGARRQ